MNGVTVQCKSCLTLWPDPHQFSICQQYLHIPTHCWAISPSSPSSSLSLAWLSSLLGLWKHTNTNTNTQSYMTAHIKRNWAPPGRNLLIKHEVTQIHKCVKRSIRGGESREGDGCSTTHTHTFFLVFALIVLLLQMGSEGYAMLCL